MKPAADDADALRRIPLPAWANVLSLDAVFVATVWQQLLMRVFCHRSTRWSEGVALSLTVWLIYVADRLLDGAKLNMDQPHTLRHGFYRRHRRIFLWLWMLGLVLNTLVVVRWLPTEVMRNGLLLSSLVLLYGASVHFTAKRAARESNVAKQAISHSRPWRFGLPKEVRVGVLFALGVSLTTWTQLWFDLQHTLQPSGVFVAALWPLLITTCALALLFTWNCMLVAKFESEFDRAQSFSSIATGGGCSRLVQAVRGHRVRGGVMLTLASVTLVGMAALGQALLSLELVRVPLPIELAGLASALGLMVAAVLPAGYARRIAPAAAPPTSAPLRGCAIFDVRGAWVDAVLWTPPLVLLSWL